MVIQQHDINAIVSKNITLQLVPEILCVLLIIKDTYVYVMIRMLKHM